ncbi:MAG: HDOD domain-containing protein, partial [Pedobacter sp.]
MASAIIPETVRKLLASQPVELPIFHPVALKLQRMLSSYEFTVEEVALVANEDMSLATHMLKIANSPMYMGRTKVATIKEAVIRLGAQQVINIAIAASQSAAHESANPALDRYMRALWLHSHGAALGARWLSLNCGMRGVADESYLAAMLHDVGKLYL